MERKSTVELQEHMLWTYYGLRVGLAVIGISLPLIVLVAGGILHHVWLEPSISRYYYTQGRPFLTTRDLFVGGLLAIGACLYLYKGFSNKENLALNLAGVFAAVVALFPTSATDAGGGVVPRVHMTAAVLFFICIAYVSLFRSRDTLPLLPPAAQAVYARRYFWTGLALIVSPLAAVVLSFALEPASRFRTIIFWVESLAVWSFAAYWIVKTLEMRESEAEKRALDAELERRVVRPPAPLSSPRAPEIEAVVPAAPKVP